VHLYPFANCNFYSKTHNVSFFLYKYKTNDSIMFGSKYYNLIFIYSKFDIVQLARMTNDILSKL
jgi:hypothetical protein